MTTQSVEMFFDPTCPWAWMTSRWLLNAAEVRDLDVTFSIMSLSALNEGRDLDPGYREAMDAAWGPARVALAITQQGSQEDVAAYYTAFGTHHHVGGHGDLRAAAEAGLAATSLDAQLIAAYEDTSLDDELRRRQQAVIDLVGDEVGTPVISFGTGRAYFGPVISPAPKGEEAGALLDGLAALASVEGFFEIKRTRTVGPIFD